MKRQGYVDFGAIVLLAAIARPAESQPPAPASADRIDIVETAAHQAVQKELGVNSDVARQLTRVRDERRAADATLLKEYGLGGDRNINLLSAAERQKYLVAQRKLHGKFIPQALELLSADQQIRLRQIQLQKRLAALDGARALKEVAGELKLSTEQQQRLDSLSREFMRELFSKSRTIAGDRGQPAQDRRQAQQKLRDDYSAKAIAALTAEQKDLLAKLKGPEFDVSGLLTPYVATGLSVSRPSGGFGSWVPYRGQKLSVVDEQEQPIAKFEVFVHTADKGYQSWRVGREGSFQLDASVNSFAGRANKLDVIIRAAGYAPAVRSFSGDALSDLRLHGAKFTLQQGRQVRLKLRLPEGMSFPENLSPDFYFPDFAWRVEMMWQSVNERPGQVNDFNLLGAQTIAGAAGEYVLRLPREQTSFFVGIYHPGWLRYFKAGPFTAEDFTGGELAIDLPRPGAIAVRLDCGPQNPDDSPFAGVQYRLGRETGRDRSFWVAATHEGAPNGAPLEASDLAPGRYRLTATTKPKHDDAQAGGERAIHPGRFSTSKMYDLQPGQSLRDTLAVVPFNADAYRGDRTALLRITGDDGRPAAGKPILVQWFDGHYGALTVFDGPIPADGVVTLREVSAAVTSDSPYGPFHVSVAGERLGFFRLTADEGAQEFSFSLLAKRGDMAPDAELVALESAERVRLKDFRGQIVYLEFWQTWCGPCQTPMAQLDALAASQAAAWRGRVALVPVCLDRDAEVIATHVKTRGWTNLRHYRSERTGAAYLADAQRAFGVMSYPTALLIDASGKIVWRGHPTECDLAAEVERLERASARRP